MDSCSHENYKENSQASAFFGVTDFGHVLQSLWVRPALCTCNPVDRFLSPHGFHFLFHLNSILFLVFLFAEIREQNYSRIH
jgi:hypothetical protein